MCGKFTQMASWNEVVAFSQPLAATIDGALAVYTTPMRWAKIIRLGEDGKRELVSMRWGFSKHGAASPKPDHMHARGESVDSRPRFCDAFGERRAILMVETFNEGEQLDDGRTQQWVIRPKDSKPVPIAVIWEDWQGEAQALPTFIQITAPANALISRVTDRMPAIIEQKDWPVWLGEVDAPFSEIKALLKTHDDQGGWEMELQSRAKRASSPPPPKPQMELF